MMKLECLLLVLALFASAVARNEAIPGGIWTPIQNLNDPHVTEIAKYAVTEFDKRSGSGLTFQKVTNGFTQVVAGINYRLILVADGGGSAHNLYQAIVLEKPQEHFRNLISFTAFYD